MKRSGLNQFFTLALFGIWATVLLAACPAQAFFLPMLVKDINPGYTGSFPFQLTEMNGTLFFVASDGVSGSELWKSNGTYLGTTMVKDITPGPESTDINGLKNVNGTLFFVIQKATTGAEEYEYELWKSNGTEAGTVKVAGPFPSFGSLHNMFAIGPLLQNVNGTVYFFASDSQGHGLWKSNGTAGGTVKVKNNLWVWQLGLNKGGILYFSAADTSTGNLFAAGLWRTDGTDAGTYEVKPIFPSFNALGYMTIKDDYLFLGANDNVYGPELWRSDGTANGTTLVQDILVGAQGSGPERLTKVGDILFFSADNGVSGKELWAYQQQMFPKQQPYHASMVKDIRAGSQSSYPQELTELNGLLFFTAQTSDDNRELYVSDGTEAGTKLVKDIQPYSVDYMGYHPEYLTGVNDRLFFAADDGVFGRELWMSDGTAEGTNRVTDIYPNQGSSWPGDLTKVNGTLFFAAQNGDFGRELWKLVEINKPDPRQWILANLFEDQFKKGGIGLKNAMLSIMGEVNLLMAQGNISAAIQKLQNVRRHVDGYETGFKQNDWVVEETAQNNVRNMIDGLITDLNRIR